MRLSTLVEKTQRPLISFEFFPPRTEKAAATFEGVIDELAALKPDYVSVTFGAGGSTTEGSYQLVKKLHVEKGLPTVAYLAGYGLGPGTITSVLDAYRGLGIETIFVIRGDAPANNPDFKAHPESMAHASDLIGFIKERYDFCLGCAAYPEGHLEAESKGKDLEYLKLKTEQGAQYVVSQYAYDDSFFPAFVERVRAVGVQAPIFPGIMPIYSEKLTRNLASVCGTTITGEIDQALAALPPDDKQAVIDYGADLATRQARALLKAGAAGLHFYTMNRAGTVSKVLQTLRAEGAL